MIGPADGVRCRIPTGAPSSTPGGSNGKAGRVGLTSSVLGVARVEAELASDLAAINTAVMATDDVAPARRSNEYWIWRSGFMPSTVWLAPVHRMEGG